MRTLKHNGEKWYIDSRSPFKRARQWLAWFGGWEKANGAGWQFRIPTTRMVGGKLQRQWIPMGPTPVALFGHRVTFYGWGINVRVGDRRGGILCWHWQPGQFGRGYCYTSRDGTPHRATRWFWGWESYFGTSRLDRLEDPR